MDRVQDHCHILGHYRGEAHNACNLNYRIDPAKWKLPVILHNLRGYDSHLIVKALKKKYGRTCVIANNMESYITLSVDQLQFLDSMQFTNASLEKLVTTHLTRNLCAPRNHSTMRSCTTESGLPIWLYGQFRSFQRYPKSTKESIYNKLNDVYISDSQYEHTQRMDWIPMSNSNGLSQHLSQEWFIAIDRLLRKVLGVHVYQTMGWILYTTIQHLA